MRIFIVIIMIIVVFIGGTIISISNSKYDNDYNNNDNANNMTIHRSPSWSAALIPYCTSLAPAADFQTSQAFVLLFCRYTGRRKVLTYWACLVLRHLAE